MADTKKWIELELSLTQSIQDWIDSICEGGDVYFAPEVESHMASAALQVLKAGDAGYADGQD